MNNTLYSLKVVRGFNCKYNTIALKLMELIGYFLVSTSHYLFLLLSSSMIRFQRCARTSFCFFGKRQIATQMAVLIGRIARLDCPRNWPELVPAVMDAVMAAAQQNNALVHERALQTLHHIVKTLASKRLMQDRKLFEEVNSH